MTNPVQQALIGALTTEYAAVFSYGIVAAYASPQRDGRIAEYTGAHRVRRDSTIDTLMTAGVTVPPPDPAYTAPLTVTDPISAAKLAVTIESDCARAWRAVVERATTTELRRTATDALTECALRLANWQAILGVTPPTTAFPGTT